MNACIFGRLDDALRTEAVAEIEARVAPLDTPLWFQANLRTGVLVLSEQEPILRIIATGTIPPVLLRRALTQRLMLSFDSIRMDVRVLLERLGISANRILAGSAEVS